MNPLEILNPKPQISKDDTENQKENDTRLFEAQQNFLRPMRRNITRIAKEVIRAERGNCAICKKIYEDVQYHILDKVHVGLSWQELSELLFFVHKVGRKGDGEAILIGGFHRPVPSSISSETVAAVSNALLKNLADHNFFIWTMKLDGKSEEFRSWIEEYREYFKCCIHNDGTWYYEDIMKECVNSRNDLRKKIEDNLLFMANQSIIFYPTSGDPRAGWEDFIIFVRLYNQLPPYLRDSFGPYYFLIQSQSSS